MVFDDSTFGIPAGGLAPSNDFNNAGGRNSAAADPLNDALSRLEKAIGAHADHLSPAEIETIIARLEGKSRAGLYNQLISHYQDYVEGTLRGLSHPEAPRIGANFVAAYKKAKPHFVISPRQIGQANFAAFHLGKGRINEVSFNPDLIDIHGKPHIFAGATNHELAHLLHYAVTPALKCVAWNPNTNILIHPLDKARIDKLCEQDAYVKQALLNVLMVRARANDPAFRAMMIKDTAPQVINTREMETYMERAGSLREAMANAGLACMDKFLKDWQTSGRTFRNSYFDISLDDYRAALSARKDRGENYTFVRLEPADFLAVDSYGVGPRYLDERFTQPVELNDEEQFKLAQLCIDYDIPLLQDCSTLRAATAPAPKIPRAEKTFSLPAPSFIPDVRPALG